MLGILSVSPFLPPAIGFAVGLLALYVGWSTLRARALPALIEPLMRANIRLSRPVFGEHAAQAKAQIGAHTYGWAFIYAGATGIIIAGAQLARLLALLF